MPSETSTIEKKKQTTRQLKEPGKFKVVVCNDDVTPVEFVVAMLSSVFGLEKEAAIELTLDVHNNGRAVAGIYPHEIAEQKSVDATTMARNNGFPLQIKVEPE
jgi:ATP-dependent Clp protease adaptor protein ClpS